MNPYASVTQLRSGLDNGDFSADELAHFYLDRIDAAEDLNCFITVDAEGVLAAAKRADKAIADKRIGPLTGIPIAHKDIFCTRGLLTSCASRMLNNFVAPYDATVVDRLKRAGAITIGKTNMDEFAMGSSNETSFYGPVKNPWDRECVPGGSSGGSAAAVAAGLAAACTGSDTGGSIRQPASFCGVTGLKPTYGRVSRYGMIAFASSLDQGGPLARSASDAGTLLNAMEGYDPNDSTSAIADPTDIFSSSRALKIGIPSQYWNDLSPSLTKVLEEARRTLESLGHRAVPVELPHTNAATAVYYVIAGAEASTNLSRYDGIRYGHRAASPENLEDLYQFSRSEGFGSEVKRRILTGTYALSVGYYDAYYLKAQQIRRLIRQDFLDAFGEADIILTPVSPSTAFKREALIEDPISMYQQDIYTTPASLAGLPALSLPCGVSDQMPVGMQFIGPHFGESLLLTLGREYQSETDWHALHPADNHD
ncbi:MAG: Asp-tRNA(Asn)/Glu-tRNA(Gln) amidotransferase subunit GatA [Pseudomonadales bacterium]|nr:Asp-tRNA(Asn)/Glu-tRNA(Gln) amidotransferase subunit GatA [Pseudomonadales bacterium]